MLLYTNSISTTSWGTAKTEPRNQNEDHPPPRKQNQHAKTTKTTQNSLLLVRIVSNHKEL